MRAFRCDIAWLMCFGLFVLLTRSASADDLRKVEYWNYTHCVGENFFMTDDAKVLNESCQCYAAEVTPFMAAEYQQAVIKSEFPYKGPKPISDTMLGIVLMARCPATTPLVEMMWCGPNRENPAGASDSSTCAAAYSEDRSRRGQRLPNGVQRKCWRP